jgi:hypothetical protein
MVGSREGQEMDEKVQLVMEMFTWVEEEERIAGVLDVVEMSVKEQRERENERGGGSSPFINADDDE